METRTVTDDPNLSAVRRYRSLRAPDALLEISFETRIAVLREVAATDNRGSVRSRAAARIRTLESRAPEPVPAAVEGVVAAVLASIAMPAVCTRCSRLGHVGRDFGWDRNQDGEYVPRKLCLQCQDEVTETPERRRK